MAHETAASPNQSAGPTRCREFSLFDAMILVAGVALSLSMGAYVLVFMAREFGRLCMNCRGPPHEPSPELAVVLEQDPQSLEEVFKDYIKGRRPPR